MNTITPECQAARLASLGPLLSKLPDALISVITFYLDVPSLGRLQATSKLLRIFACEEPLWYHIATSCHEGRLLYKANWRQTALALYFADIASSSETRSQSSSAAQELALTAAAAPPPPVPGFSSDFLYRRWYRGHADISAFHPAADGLQRVDAAALNPAEFERQFDAPARPVVLAGAMDSWPLQQWSLAALSEAHGSCLFEVSKPSGGKAPMALAEYLSYMQRQCDEEPLYVFDASFGERVPALLELYRVPAVFQQDLLSLLGPLRPDYRWLVLGPARTGAAWHVDPHLTSAWNALISGRKRWALYPPHIVPPGVTLVDDGEGGVHSDSLTALQWFLEVLPSLPAHLRPIEVLQRPGEVMFVPGGWWHAVLNLEPSVAVTQNFASVANLERVARHMAHGSAAYHADVEGHYAVPPAAEPAAAAAGGKGRRGLATKKKVQRAARQMAGLGLSDANGRNGTLQHRQKHTKAAHSKHSSSAPAASLDIRVLHPEALTGSLADLNAPHSTLVIAHYHQQSGHDTQHLQPAAADGSQPASPTSSTAPRSIDLLVTQQTASSPGGLASCLANGEQHSTRELGRWLHLLWTQQPQLRPQLQRICEQWLGTAEWQQLLGAICRAHGIHEPGFEGCLPLCGASSAVFVVGDGAVVKLQLDTDALAAAHMAAAEAAACQLLQQHQEPQQEHQTTADSGAAAAAPAGMQVLFPRVLGTGTVHYTQHKHSQDEEDSDGEHSGSDSEQQQQGESPQGHPTHHRLPYLLLSRAPGSGSLKAKWPALQPEQRAAVASAIGAALARVHTLPLPSKAGQPAANGGGQAAHGSHHGSAAAASSITLQNTVSGAAGNGACNAGSAGAVSKGCSTSAAGVSNQPCSSAAAPQPVSPEAAHAVAAAVVQGTWWRDRDGTMWSAHLGCLSGGEEGGGACSMSSSNTRDASSSGSGGSSVHAAPSPCCNGVSTQAAPAAAATAAAMALVPEAWWPFAQFLRCRQAEVLEDAAAGIDGGPGWLQQQLPGYLPQDPAALLGFGMAQRSSGTSTSRCCSTSSCSGSGAHPISSASGTSSSNNSSGVGADVIGPCWLHGDVMSGNVMLDLQAPWQQQCHGPSQQANTPGAAGTVSLIDFGDGGHGDPCWDFVPVFAACLGCCNADLMQACLCSYWATSTGQHHMQHWSGRGVALSYVLMCYLLLHEEGFMGLVLKRWPELWEAGNTLQALEQQLFGSLSWPGTVQC